MLGDLVLNHAIQRQAEAFGHQNCILPETSTFRRGSHSDPVFHPKPRNYLRKRSRVNDSCTRHYKCFCLLCPQSHDVSVDLLFTLQTEWKNSTFRCGSSPVLLLGCNPPTSRCASPRDPACSVRFTHCLHRMYRHFDDTQL